jgi:hypothetical protein
MTFRSLCINPRKTIKDSQVDQGYFIKKMVKLSLEYDRHKTLVQLVSHHEKYGLSLLVGNIYLVLSCSYQLKQGTLIRKEKKNIL